MQKFVNLVDLFKSFHASFLRANVGFDIAVAILAQAGHGVVVLIHET